MVPNGPGTRSLEINSNGENPRGYSAGWTAYTPSGALKIVGVYTPIDQVTVDCSLAADGFTAEFLWGDAQVYGTQQLTASPSGPTGSVCSGVGINRQIQPSRYFGIASGCYLQSICKTSDNGRLLGVHGIDLEVEEDTGPTITPSGFNNLWYAHNRWVRGTWPISFTASDPSGVCSTAATVDGHVINGSVDYWLDTSQWRQCPQLGFEHQLDTTQYPNGPMSLTLDAGNAPGIESSPSEAFNVDNQPVSLELTGPTDALSTSGTQYIDATASAGPSGVSAILCSLDGAPMRPFPGPAVRIGVQGLGAHHLSCAARNGAIDSSYAPGSSQTQTWNLNIRQPSVSTVSFARIADKLRCAKQRERVLVPARWIYERVHGHRVRVRVPAQRRTIKVVRCHPRVVTRRVRIGGHWVTERVLVLPRRLIRRTRRIRFGAKTNVSGWLGTTDGNALGGQPVRILTAPDNGTQRFSTAATVVTKANGGWTVRLPAGPSRLVRAVYGGSSTIEPARSAPARVVVPASASLRISPRVTHWGGTIRIRGRLRGGFVPRAGELIVLWIGWSGGSTEIGHLYTRRDGRFSSPYTFLRGNGTVSYRLWATPARESDYPFAPARSPTTMVTVRP